MIETVRTDLEVEHIAQFGQRTYLRDVLLNTDAELSWFPATVLDALGVERKKIGHFRQANGTVLTRSTGFVVVRVQGIETADEVVFREVGDLVLLGARSLEGLNLRVEPEAKRLVDAGPAPAAAVA